MTRWIHGGSCRCIACKIDQDVVLTALAGEWGSGNWWAKSPRNRTPSPTGAAGAVNVPAEVGT
jgi:hypothetical protein